MADPFIAEIRIFPFEFAPKDWAFCDGQIVPISQNQKLFDLVKTTYGGDGKTGFALPDLRGSAAMGPDPYETQFPLGAKGGETDVQLAVSEMPSHSHIVKAFNTLPGNQVAPSPKNPLARSDQGSVYQSDTYSKQVKMDPKTIDTVGGNQPHNNMHPYLALNFCIALRGVMAERY